MAADQLVKSEINAGLQLVRVLDAAGFDVKAALWLYSSDADKWRFVIATPDVPKQISQKYLDAATALSSWREANPGRPVLDLSRVRLVGPDDPLIRGLTPILHLDGLGEIRFSHNLVNGIYVEDALVHRLAA